MTTVNRITIVLKRFILLISQQFAPDYNLFIIDKLVIITHIEVTFNAKNKLVSVSIYVIRAIKGNQEALC